MSGIEVHNQFLKTYLEYVEETECPRIFHVMSVLTGVGAALGRRCHIPFGTNVIWPNIYTVLVGPPAAKKSSAINPVKKLLKNSTAVRFAPDDTGGKRQGMVTAIENKLSEEDEKIMAQLDAAGGATIDALAGLDLGRLSDNRDKHTLFAAASELGSLLGINQPEMLTFLIKMYDGDPYKYQLSKVMQEITDALVSILAATTPSSLAEMLPPAAIGGGFMSRVLLIYGNTKYKSIPWPEPPNQHLEDEVSAVFQRLADFEGEIVPNRAAKKLIGECYEEAANIDDARFVYYTERRQGHMLKLSLALAAARFSHVIEPEDFMEARRLLMACEAYMPEALGEFGMNKLSSAKQKLLEYVKQVRAPVLLEQLYQFLTHDMTKLEYTQALADLVNANKLTQVTTKKGIAVVAVDRNYQKMQELFETGLIDEEDEEPEPQLRLIK